MGAIASVILKSVFEGAGMASLLRSLVASPRQRHPEAGLDLCYVTDNIVVTSGPSSTYPQRAYRNPTDQLVKWLDSKHGKEWAIWEFRAEGTGYPDSEVYGRVNHYPWPDHHPPPFHLVPNIVASMRNWLHDADAKDKGRTVVVHCKAGKGRSGTVATSYLISQEGWTVADALNRFTQRRMRQGFGAGVSIPSQIRWVGYVDMWTKSGKKYLERKVEVVEVHVWGLRDGVKVSVEGFVDDGKKIKSFHTFKKKERLIVDASNQNGSLLADLMGRTNEAKVEPGDILDKQSQQGPNLIDDKKESGPTATADDSEYDNESGGKAVIFRPSEPIKLETSDVCIDFERRNRARYGWTWVTSVAHVWFNTFFEGVTQAEGEADLEHLPKNGVFTIEWDAMDGIKGTSRKGFRALDRVSVVWRALDENDGTTPKVIVEPKPGEPVPDVSPADWKGEDPKEIKPVQKDLGLREESPASADVSKANSVKSTDNSSVKAKDVESDDNPELIGTRSHGLDDIEPVAEKTEVPDTTGIEKNDAGKMSSFVDSLKVAASNLKGTK